MKLNLIDKNTSRVTEVILPDVSGETFRDQWEQRKTTRVFDDLAQQATGALLFIHPDTIRNPVRINLNREVASILETERIEPAIVSESVQSGFSETKWSPKFSPTQVKLTELLQFLTRESHIYPLKRIALIVSAWDLLRDDYLGPATWIAEELPLLHQFMKANSDKIPYKVFGVSAQGGPLNEPECLHLHGRQSQRIEVVTENVGEYADHDITAPIKWLMI